MEKWTHVHDDHAFSQALQLARSRYQDDLLQGLENLSGSTLTGSAASYGGSYARSRRALLRRLTAAGVPWGETRGVRGRRELVIGIGAARA